ncbi:substrate-binding periplasmic protein [Thalassotalea fusca]
MNSIRVMLIFIIVLCCVYTPLHATESRAIPLKFVTEHLPPFQIIGKTKVEGFVTEILEAALARAKITPDISIYSWTRAYNLALQRPNTCIYSIARTQERENKFMWIEVVATTDSHFITVKDRVEQIDIKSLESAKNYRTAVLRDDFTHQYLINAGFIENKNLYVVNNTRSLLQLLKSKKYIDLILADPLTIHYRAIYNKMDPEQFVAIHKVNANPINFYVACSLSTEKSIIEALSNALEWVKQSGEYQNILRRWSIHKFPDVTK